MADSHSALTTRTFYDVTVPLRPEMVTWPGEPGPEFRPLAQIARGDPANVTHVGFGSHTGTHIDAPVHFIPGAAGLDAIPLAVLIGPALVLDTGDIAAIDAAWLEAAALPAGTERALFRTRNSQRDYLADSVFHRDFVHVAPDGARWLVERGLRLVGIDYLSIERFDADPHEVHVTLLAAGVVIVEGLDLRAVPAGKYLLACLPPKIPGGDGAPARAVLWQPV